MQLAQTGQRTDQHIVGKVEVRLQIQIHDTRAALQQDLQGAVNPSDLQIVHHWSCELRALAWIAGQQLVLQVGCRADERGQHVVEPVLVWKST